MPTTLVERFASPEIVEAPTSLAVSCTATNRSPVGGVTPAAPVAGSSTAVALTDNGAPVKSSTTCADPRVPVVVVVGIGATMT